MIFTRPGGSKLTARRGEEEWEFSYCVTAHDIQLHKYAKGGEALYTMDAWVDRLRLEEVPLPADVEEEVMERFRSSLKFRRG